MAANGSAPKAQINDSVFCNRLNNLYQTWQNDPGLFNGAGVLLIAVGGQDPETPIRYLKSIATQLWLFQYEIPDTLIAIGVGEIHIVCSEKKEAILSSLTSATKAQCGLQITFHKRPKKTDGSEQIQALLGHMDRLRQGAPIGTFVKETTNKHVGVLMDSLKSALSGVDQVEIGGGLGSVMGAKDNDELKNVKKAGFLAAGVMQNYFVKELERVIEAEDDTSHEAMADDIKKVITDPVKANIRLLAQNCDVALNPIVQSGGDYDLHPVAVSTDNKLDYGCIYCGLFTKYNFYCAAVARTYYIDSGKEMEARYKAVLTAQAAAIEALGQVGQPLSTVMGAVVSSLKSSGFEDMVGLLGKSVGYGVGLEVKDPVLALNHKNGTAIKEGMTFNVTLGIQPLELPSPVDNTTHTYCIVLADTVAVKPGGGAEILTHTAKKQWSDVAYNLNTGEEEVDEEEELKMEAQDLLDGQLDGSMGRRGRGNRGADGAAEAASNEAARQAKQQELLNKLNKQTLERITAQKGVEEKGGSGVSGRRVTKVTCYNDVDKIPRQPSSGKQLIAVDRDTETFLVPVYGVLVPFHIMTVRNVAYQQDADHAYIRINFNVSGQYEAAQEFPNAIKLKELSYRTSDLRHASTIVQEIKQLRQITIARDKERAERATLVEQEVLRQGKRVYRLPDLWVRPPLTGKGRKLPGVFEMHDNGFRYRTPKHGQLDIMFNNIKHAFFQPAKKEMVTILHFHLHNPIMVGKKKTNDVQVYSEVMEVVATLDMSRRHMYDPDEVQEEQREREKRNRINADFQQFVKRVQEYWEKKYHDLNLEFDIPFRELGFQGVPYKSTVFVMPTVYCLIELIEYPFFVVSLNDIEIVNLERVGFNLKNFDMAIVFKDFSREVRRIDAIPSTCLEDVKTWLNQVNIKYYESKMNLVWKPILKSITEDPEGFFETGGWDFLDGTKSDEDDDVEEQEEEFVPTSGEEEEGSDEISSEEESVVDSDDDEDGVDSDDDEEQEEEGKTWDELEKEAKRQDDEKRDDSDDDRYQRKRPKGVGGGGVSEPGFDVEGVGGGGGWGGGGGGFQPWKVGQAGMEGVGALTWHGRMLRNIIKALHFLRGLVVGVVVVVEVVVAVVGVYQIQCNGYVATIKQPKVHSTQYIVHNITSIHGVRICL